MFFLPYRLDHAKRGLPIFTFLVMLVCILLYTNQFKADRAHEGQVISFCSSLNDLDRQVLRDLKEDDGINYCAEIFEQIHSADEPYLELESLADNAPIMKIFANASDSRDYTAARLYELYRKYQRQVPARLTSELAYDPNQVDWLKMLTSTIAHGDAMHLFGNLLFFYIFSAAVELLLGSLLYLLFFFSATVVTSLAYTMVMAGVQGALPTVGLSGVVMASLACLTVLAPFARIRCFLWVIVFFKRFTLPVMFIAVWYIGWDVYEMHRRGMSNGVNYIAHISGAGLGVAFALLVKMTQSLIRRERLEG